MHLASLSLAAPAFILSGACTRPSPDTLDNHALKNRVLYEYIEKHRASFRPSVTLQRSSVPVPGLFDISAHCVYGGPDPSGGVNVHESTLLLRARLLEVTQKGLLQIWDSGMPAQSPVFYTRIPAQVRASRAGSAHEVARFLEFDRNGFSASVLERSQDVYWRFEWMDGNAPRRSTHMRFVVDGVVVQSGSPWADQAALRAVKPGANVYNGNAAVRVADSRDINAASMEPGARTVHASVDFDSRDDDRYLYDNMGRRGK